MVRDATTTPPDNQRDPVSFRVRSKGGTDNDKGSGTLRYREIGYRGYDQKVRGDLV